ncbi:MAG: WYL domain-containing protein [Deltaproteobacteria bacterium]|nr:WYL domain-containing protein [Deltaproteobacteria bacterium]
MASAIVRQWHLLSLLPKGPRRVDSATLAMQLRLRGLVVHHRTVQRDLVELARVFPIVSDARTKPYGWRWRDDAELSCAIPALPGDLRGLPEIELWLRVEKAALRSVTEGLRGAESARREVTALPAGEGATHVELRAVVQDRCALRRWLFGFGDRIEVLGPPELRAELADRAARLAAVYHPSS